jgi:hypothetical protein
MFIRKKRAGRYDYLQVVENHREGSHTRQRVVATLGRLDRLQADGDIDTLMRSLERFCAQVKLQEAHSRGELRALGAWSIGPELIFGRLWDRLKLPAIIGGLLEGRKFEFDVEKAIFVTVLHRLFEAGSDRQAARWMTGVSVAGAEGIQLFHLYRVMRWLGGVKDRIEDGFAFLSPGCVHRVFAGFLRHHHLYYERVRGRGWGDARAVGPSKTAEAATSRWLSGRC